MWDQVLEDNKRPETREGQREVRLSKMNVVKSITEGEREQVKQVSRREIEGGRERDAFIPVQGAPGSIVPN